MHLGTPGPACSGDGEMGMRNRYRIYVLSSPTDFD